MAQPTLERAAKALERMAAALERYATAAEQANLETARFRLELVGKLAHQLEQLLELLDKWRP